MKRTFDLIVRGGTLVTSRATYRADIAVANERIAAIGVPGDFDGLGAGEILDAQGRYVLPGIIDEHVHFREPGLEYKEDFGTGSRSAVMGGVTTVLDMPNTLPPTSSAERVRQKQHLAAAKAYCDVGVYGLLDQDSVEQLEPMAQAGVIGFKCFLGRSTGDILPPDDGRLLAALSVVARLGMRCGFHAENDAILQHAATELKATGRTDPLAHVASRPVVAEVEAIQRAALFAATTGASIHIFHLSSAAGLATVEEWRRKGVDVTCEVTPQHCFLEASHAQALLAGLASGAISAIGTDHSPHLASEKVHDDIWQAVSGFAGVEISLRLFLTYGVHAGAISLCQLVRATSEAQALAWGLYPRKGCLQVGSDADVTVVDLEREDVVEERRLHGKNNLTPFEGRRTHGAAVASVVRGSVVMRDGELVGEPRGRIVEGRRTIGVKDR